MSLLQDLCLEIIYFISVRFPIREKGDAESLFSKDASGQPPDAQMDDVILAGWVQCLIVVVKALWTEKASLNVERW